MGVIRGPVGINSTAPTLALRLMWGRLCILAKLAENLPKLAEYLRLAYDTGGSTVRDEYLYTEKDPINQYKMFQNQLQGLQIRMGNALLPGLSNFMDEAFGPMGELIKEMEGPIGEMGTEFGKTIAILVRDPAVKKAFTELAKAAPKLITTLLPAIPDLADFAARAATALMPLTNSVLELLVNGVCMIAPLLGPIAQALGAVLNFFVGNGVGKGIMGLLLPGSSAILGNPIDNFVGAAKDKEARKAAALMADNRDMGFFKSTGNAAKDMALLNAYNRDNSDLHTGNIQEGGGKATGAVFTKPATIWGTQIAEREAEGIFPLSYLNELLADRGGGDSFHFTYSPNYTVGPGTDMRELKKTDEQQQREFERRMDRWMAKKGRLRFAKA